MVLNLKGKQTLLAMAEQYERMAAHAEAEEKDDPTTSRLPIDALWKSQLASKPFWCSSNGC